MAGAGLLFTALAFAIYGWYAFHGGFIADDWVNADNYYFAPESGFWGSVDNYQTLSRPMAAVYVTLTYTLLGNNFDAHLLLAVLLAAFLSAAFYAFLRTLGLDWKLALAASVLLLVFPSSDSTRFWSTGSQINLFIGLYLVAISVGITGRRRWGPSPSLPAVATQLLASGLAVTAVAGYEIVAPAVLLSVLFYRWVGGKGGSVWRWLMDAIPTILVLYFYTRKFGESAGGEQLLTNFRLVADGGVSVLGYTLVPQREFARWLVFGAVAAMIAALTLIRFLTPPSPERDAITQWLPPILLSIAAIAIGYAMIVPAADRYPIYAPGVQNRTNCFAALGFCALVVFLAAAAAAILAAALPKLSERQRARLRWTLAAGLVLAMVGACTMRTVQSEARWTLASKIQREVIAGANELVPSPPNDAVIFTSPFPGYAARSIPAFGGGGNNDEVGAFRVNYDSDEMRAFPILRDTGLVCETDVVFAPSSDNGDASYGKAILIDYRTHTVYRPDNKRECMAAARAMEPFAPTTLREDW